MPYRSRIFLLTTLALVSATGWGVRVFGQGGARAGARSCGSLLRGTLSLRDACRAGGVPYPPTAPRLVVRKGERRLGVYCGSTLVKEYAVGLGPAPTGHKEQQGDGRTPEGDYYVCTRLERSRFHRFLGLSYPGAADARRAARSGLITSTDRDRILDAQRLRKQPPWNTRLGGAVGIHGSGGGSDWTAGCIAVEDAEIDELFTALPLGTPVTIQP